MKKLYTLVAATLIAGVISVQAEYGQQATSGSVVTTNAVTAVLPIKGEIANIYFDVAATKTGTLNIVSSEGYMILGVTNVSADTMYAVRIPTHTTLGGAITEIGGGATNDTANVIYSRVVTVGDVTATISPKSDTTGTNNWGVQINFVK